MVVKLLTNFSILYTCKQVQMIRVC